MEIIDASSVDELARSWLQVDPRTGKTPSTWRYHVSQWAKTYPIWLVCDTAKKARMTSAINRALEIAKMDEVDACHAVGLSYWRPRKPTDVYLP